MEEEDDDYISYGTPLPDIEDAAVVKKKAARELQVRDEEGRQRFHGAFTGGFSAGYFNTVSTKEGWAPSSFISSRNKIAERVQQNPEDFMDDEDLGEFGIATRKIHTASNFQDISKENLRKRKFVTADAIIPGEAPLKDIVKPVRESIGIKILRKLGWRPGQGIGPRVKKYGPGKVYGCSPFPDDVIHEEDDPIAVSFTFAPEDTEAVFYKPKDNYFGLGYTGLSKESVLSSRVDEFVPTTAKSWLSKEKRKLTISGQAFGVGAFEDDDEDIYSKDDMSQYDFSAEVSVPVDKSKKDLKAANSNSVLEGFNLASHPAIVKKHYPPPSLPPDFKPLHQRASSYAQKETRSKSRHNFTAEARSLILGEMKFHSQPLNDNKKGEIIQMSQCSPIVNTNTKPGPSFQPFPSDLAKQQRYEEYLKLKNSGEIEKLKQPSSFTEWEKQQELEEFARASVLFKPLSFALSSRFESRSHLSVEHEVMGALEKLKKEKEEKKFNIKKNLIGTSNRKSVEWHPASLLCKRFNVPNPYPNSCSDGVPKSQNRKSLFDQLSFTDQSSKPQEILKPISSENKADKIAERDSEKRSHEDSEKLPDVVPVQSNKGDSFENERPPIDFFKDIFENTSSEDEDEDETKAQTQKEESSGTSFLNSDNKELSLSSSLVSSTSNNMKSENQETTLSDRKTPAAVKKAGFGVFANIDLDALNKQAPKVFVQSSSEMKNVDPCENRNTSETNPVITNDNPVISKTVLSDELYGPELPPNYTVSSSSSSVEVVSRKHAKHKSKHKHKHHKRKSSKKKRKKSSKKHSEESNSSDEQEDIPPTLIIEKLKQLQKKMK